MDVKIRKTGERENLIIIDPDTGIDWINDLMGNCNELPEYDEDAGCYVMTRDDFEWWDDLTIRYQKADDRYHSLLTTLNNNNSKKLFNDVQNIYVDLENYPEALNDACDACDNY